MNNLVKFPKAKKNLPTHTVLNIKHRYIEHGPRRIPFLPWSIFLNILTFLVECLRSILLTLLLWFRPLLFVVCRPVSGLMLIAFIICLFSHPHDPRLTYGFGIFSFSVFLIMHLYDGLLVMLSRANTINILN
jgi:hypothetical protein